MYINSINSVNVSNTNNLFIFIWQSSIIFPTQIQPQTHMKKHYFCNTLNLEKLEINGSCISYSRTFTIMRNYRA